MTVEQRGEPVNVAAFEFEGHHRGDALNLLQRGKAFCYAANVAADNVAQQVARKAALPGVNQREALVKFTLRFGRKLDVPHAEPLLRARRGQNKLHARRHPSDLILPAAAGGHYLLHAHDAVVQIAVRMRDGEILVQRFRARAGKDGAGAQPAALGHVAHERGQIQAAGLRQHVFERAAFARNHAAGDQRGLVQREGIVRIVAVL